MLSKEQILNLAERLTTNNPGNVGPTYLQHLTQVGDIAVEILGNIRRNNSSFSINFDEVASTAYLHDIGRPLAKEQGFHEFRGARFVEQNGIKEDIADSSKDIFRIAQVIRSHGFAFESWQEQGYSDLRKEFGSLDSNLLIPRTWQEAIIAYSDLASLGGKRVTMQERMGELLERYKKDPNFKDQRVVRVANAAYPQVLELGARVEALEQGKLTDGEIARYGFL